MSIPKSQDELHQQRSPQKKRVLSDINNVYLNQPLKKKDDRRRSLGFDMARIDLPTDVETHAFESHIPPAPARSLFTSKNMTEKNRRSTHIPAPVNNTRPDLNIQHINKLLGVNQSLTRKPQMDYKTSSKPSLRTRLSNVEQSFTRDLARQTEINHELDLQVKELETKADELEYELLDLKRSQKKLDHRLSDLRQSFNSQKKKFEFMEDSVMKNVLHKEQLINVQIKDLSNKLTTEYNEVKFQLQDELEKAKAYKDKATLDEIHNLNSKIEQLQNQLEETKSRKQQTLKSETTELEKQLEKYLLTKVEEVDKLTNTFQEKQTEYEEVLGKEIDIKNQIKLKEEESNSLKESINRIESNMTNYSDIRSSLLLDLRAEEDTLADLENKNREWDKNLGQSQKEYDSAFEKVKKFNQQRRIIENSIMDYEGKIRVYAKVSNSMKITKQQEIEYNNQFFKFNKCFASNVPNGEIVEEFEAFINNAISGCNCSVILSGNRSNNLIFESIISTYKSIIQKSEKFKEKSWEFEYHLKCVAIGNQNLDLLGSLKPIKLQNFKDSLSQIFSQQMDIEDPYSLAKIISGLDIPEGTESVAYIINVDAKNCRLQRSYESNIMFLDITNIQYSIQNDLLNAQITQTSECTDLIRILKYSYLQSKCLHISALDIMPDSDLPQFLKTLENVNSSETPYKKKN